MLIFLIILFSAILSYLATIPTIRFAKRLLLVTDKRFRIHPAHTHRGRIPRGGGIPIFISLLITSLLVLSINKIMAGILISCALLVLVGLLDDYTDSSPYFRFIANILISALVVSFGLGIPYISNPFGGVIHLDTWRLTFDFFGRHSILILGDLAAIIWLTWTTNTINWSKGVDGQLPGFVAIAAFFLGLLANRFTAHDISTLQVTYLSFIVAGAYLGFLPHNFYPQKIMPGYGGGGLAGFLLGILSILSFGKIGTAILILSVPLVDATYTILRRITLKKSPFRADWGHFHHKLLDIGWGRRRIAVFYWIITAVLGVASLLLKGPEKAVAFATCALLLVSFMIITSRLKKHDLVK